MNSTPPLELFADLTPPQAGQRGSLSVAIVRRFRLLRVGEWPRKADQFLYCGEAPGEKRGWKIADANLLADWRGPVPTWYKGRYRRRVLPNRPG